MTSHLCIVMSGMMAGDPRQGGATWAVLQYLLGLRAMGHDVYFVEPVAPRSLRPEGASLPASANAAYFHDVTTAFGLEDRAGLLLEGTRNTVGLSYEALLAAAARADLLINVSGMLTDTRVLERVPRRLYLDWDPGFNQLWHAVEGIDLRFDAHTHFATVGLRVGTPACAVPACGRRWLPTLQPVVLSEWPVADQDGTAWTTVGNWRGYGSIRHGGVHYGQKAHSVRRLIDLPSRTRATLRPALAIHADEVNDLDALRAHRWTLADPGVTAGTPHQYRQFIQASRGEIAIAKSGYVEARCGWFSDRSVCYLASGRPVVAQDTGFVGALPTGEGLLTFTTAAEAAAAIDTVETAYPTHRRRAREIAEEWFRSERVLGLLLDAVGGVNDGDGSGLREAGRYDDAAAAAAGASL